MGALELAVAEQADARNMLADAAMSPWSSGMLRSGYEVKAPVLSKNDEFAEGRQVEGGSWQG